MFGSDSTTGIYITLVITMLAFGVSLRLRPFADQWASDLADFRHRVYYTQRAFLESSVSSVTAICPISTPHGRL